MFISFQIQLPTNQPNINLGIW